MWIFLSKCRAIFLAWALMAYAGVALGCSYAYQYSLFPVGISGGEWWMLEVEMERYVVSPEEMLTNPNRPESGAAQTRWKGAVRLGVWRKGRLAEAQIIQNQIDVADADYDKTLTAICQRGWDRAQELPFFEPAQSLDMGLCRYAPRCGFVGKEVDTLSGRFWAWAKLPGSADSVGTEIQFPEKIQAQLEKIAKQPLSDMAGQPNSSAIAYARAWKVFGARVYQAGGASVVIFSVGRGERRFYEGLPDSGWKMALPGSEAEVSQGREVLFHGQRFDAVRL